MPINPYLLSKQSISRVSGGIYHGFSGPVALGAKVSIMLLVCWLILNPDHATETLEWARVTTLTAFRAWFMYALWAFVLFCLIVVVLPISGRIRLGPNHARPDHSTASWLSMMFCAGIGAGILIYAVGEPLAHLRTNPQVIAGTIARGSPEAATAALTYTFLHWGLSAWACYAVLALAIALYSHRYKMPLTIRTALAPMLGQRFGGLWGNLIDIFSIFAITVGIATTLGYGVAQLISGAHKVTGFAPLLAADREPALLAQLAALTVIAVVATGSVISGIGRGIKWISNASTVLFFLVLLCFSLSSGAYDSLARLGQALWSYITSLPVLATTVADPNFGPKGRALAEWQTKWTIFYWAWWIAFAPFVALFLAQVSRGRSLRVFVLGCLFTPVGICLVWFAMVGGAAIDVQMAGRPGVDLHSAPLSAQITETIRQIAPDGFGHPLSLAVTLLTLMLLITTMNAAILAINMIAAAGDETRRGSFHILSWGTAITLIIGALLTSGGTGTIRDAMIIGALPFSLVIAGALISTTLSLLHEAGLRVPVSTKAELAPTPYLNQLLPKRRN